MGRALKKLAKRMLMATPAGFEPAASAVTVPCDSQLHHGAIITDNLGIANHRFFFAADKQWCSK